jgi:deoxyribodipyrimidine photolyase-related protein
MKKEALLIFPHQLFENNQLLNSEYDIFIIEHPRFFTDFIFHKQKLVLHRASMKAYQDFLNKKNYSSVYVEFNNLKKLNTQLKKYTTIYCLDLTDHVLEKELMSKFGKRLVIDESPCFITDRPTVKKMLGNKNHYVMNSFYIAQRKRLNILIKDGKPVGGKWSFDEENRLKLSNDISIPECYKPREGKYVKEAKKYIQLHFNSNPGSIEAFAWPITHEQAKKALYDFLEHRLKQFGPFQDAIVSDESDLFHSLLSSSLNNGLITPEYVLKITLDFAQTHHTPLNSLEGFIRQIIGWREFVRGIYLIKGQAQKKKNFFNHKNKLPATFWDGSTGIIPIDITIKKILNSAYAHHIERLMILGNFMLITDTNPQDVYNWFMELFIDAYDWVMVPNVFGMSQYADGGLITTKPYFSSSNYIKKMSNYKKGDWCAIWDALYWRFVLKNSKLVLKNARLSFLKLYLAQMKQNVLKEHIRVAEAFLKRKKDDLPG